MLIGNQGSGSQPGYANLPPGNVSHRGIRGPLSTVPKEWNMVSKGCAKNKIPTQRIDLVEAVTSTLQW
ncbi:hypothetical protein Cob_v006473 [Colletotrichum orbiculare MAFF 240422]|uniref:Uncharacterized protein n=1 Tax=Colletotrichum orbiculare (strain 104-T / ATCC 96160 / CBS 514.97 / LARS 414 / MAFF 240422) TaxID=1213857 RepID=A0A484FQ03_COLOR|nr:hypothetical protein Cob_v006473 [Colletotrichum orbiculare MAFF 240422]